MSTDPDGIDCLSEEDQRLLAWTAALAAEPGQLAHAGDPDPIDWEAWTEEHAAGDPISVPGQSPRLTLKAHVAGEYRLGYDSAGRFYCELVKA